MGIARGTNIVRDGLIYGYDSGYGLDNFKPTRFYKGKPAVNMLNSGDNFGNWNKTRNSGSDPTVTSDVAPGPFENTLADKLFLPNDGSYPRLYQYFTPASTATHTFSVWLKAQSPSQGVFVGAFRNSPWALPSHTSFSITDEWVNYTFAVNPLDTSSHQIYIGSHDNHKGKEFLIYGAQLETGSSRSTFVDGTRSATGGLIDLKRTTNIDISNISFHSNGQPTFDGTGDYIDVTTDFGTLNQYSFEYIENPQQTHKMPISSRLNTNFYKYGAYSWRYKHGGTLGEYYHTAGATSGWHHWVISYDGARLKIYQDNVLIGNTVPHLGSADWSGGLKIGWWSAGADYDFNGDIPVMKFYNKGLTADEVAQNYKAYKNRFNL